MCSLAHPAPKFHVKVKWRKCLSACPHHSPHQALLLLLRTLIFLTCPLLSIPGASLLGQTTITSCWSPCFCPHPLLRKEKEPVKNKSRQLLAPWDHPRATCCCRTKSAMPTVAGCPCKLPLPASLPTHPSSLSKSHGLRAEHTCPRPFAQAVPSPSLHPSTGLGQQLLRGALSEAFSFSDAPSSGLPFHL